MRSTPTYEEVIVEFLKMRKLPLEKGVCHLSRPQTHLAASCLETKQIHLLQIKKDVQPLRFHQNQETNTNEAIQETA